MPNHASNSIHSALSITYKARAIAELLLRDGENSTGFESHHNIIVSSLSAIAEFLADIESQLDNPENFN